VNTWTPVAAAELRLYVKIHPFAAPACAPAASATTMPPWNVGCRAAIRAVGYRRGRPID
jgi:hypothetical protein